ncbi:hypothetical protein [Paenibacillus paridis]|uniref:hypothetical protein n=1 Tax=Paenibacillus paridis TaxID=2583376 RepID=UPI0011216543|nr:hypothetical protein [Paenibacillus paridis]
MQTTGNLGLKKPEGTDVVDIADLNGNADIIDAAVAGKVDKETGKGLSANDYTAAEKTKLAGVAAGANAYVHPSTHPASIIVQDASNRFATDAEKAAWNAKASTAAATTTTAGLQSAADKAKLDGIAAGANNYTHPSTHAASMITIADAGSVITATNVEGAIQELFTNVSNGKNAVAAAITGMGVSASGSETHSSLATKVGNISKDATASSVDVLNGKTFYQGGIKQTGTIPVRGGLVESTGAGQWGDGSISAYFPNGYYGGGVNGGAEVKVPLVHLQNAEPDLVNSNFRADKNIFGLQGSIPIRGAGHHVPVDKTVWDGVLFIRPTTANLGAMLYEGDSWLRLDDPSFTPSNIRSGVNILGQIGSYVGSSILRASGTTYASSSGILSVTGLDFIPKLVFVCSSNASSWNTSTTFMLYDALKSTTDYIYATSNTINKGSASINSNGFVLNGSSAMGGISLKWHAFGGY